MSEYRRLDFTFSFEFKETPNIFIKIRVYKISYKKLFVYREAVTVHLNAEFGEGSGPILLDDLLCSEGASDLVDCNGWVWGVSDCKHDEDVGVTCARPGTEGGK